MTCEVFQQMLACSDTRNVLHSELIACLRHTRECRTCADWCHELYQNLPEDKRLEAGDYFRRKKAEINTAKPFDPEL